MVPSSYFDAAPLHNAIANATGNGDEVRVVRPASEGFEVRTVHGAGKRKRVERGGGGVS